MSRTASTTRLQPPANQSPGTRLVLLLRAAVFFSGAVLATFVIAPLSLFVLPFSFVWRYRFIGLWARFSLWWLECCCGLSYQVEGLQNIPCDNGIIMAKHQSAWETLALQRIFGPQVWVLKRELLWIPFFGWTLAMLEPIAIDRKAGRKAVRQVVDQGKQRLEHGRWVVIFPEGTRVAPGERKRYGIGGAVLAEQSGYPVTPVAHNAGNYWRRRSFIKYPGVIRVLIGAPIQSQGRRAADIIADVENWIENAMLEINSAEEKIPY